MPAVDTVFLGLLAAGLVCSIIELGLSAWGVYISTRPTYITSFGLAGTDYYYKPSAPGQVSFLVFCSLWSMIVSAILIAVPFVFKTISKPILGFGTLALNTLTMIFWLAGFAALSALYGGFAPTGYLGGLLAFSVIPWLIFLALTVLNLLTAFGTLKSERHGHHTLFRKSYTTDMTGHHQPAGPVAEAPRV